MVEFNFDVKPLFPEEIIKISSHDLRQPKYVKQQNRFHVPQFETIINHMGELSAMAQDLKAPITTAEKLKFSDNTQLYLMASTNKRGKPVVVGLLKVGRKDLFLYDEEKNQKKVSHVPCILDFYIYESCQRCGYGKRLFEKMLKEENWKPNKCSIDRPSEKLRGFLRKHYGLETTIPQGYRFVLYKGFFDDQNEKRAEKSPPSNTEFRRERENCFNATNCASPVKTYKQTQPQISPEHFGSRLDVCNISYKGGFKKRITSQCVTK